MEVSVNADTGKIKATRPVYGGNAMANVSFTGEGTQVVIVRPKTFEPDEPDSSRTGTIEDFAAQLDDSVIKARLIETGRPGSRRASASKTPE